MRNVFGLDSPIMNVLGRITDFIILNLIFLITCIPIVTIGPALTALYSVTLKMVKNEESYVFKGYFKAFKANFKISILGWLILLTAMIILVVDYRLTTAGIIDLGGILPIIFLMLMFICSIVIMVFFPYVARFEGTLKVSFKNSFIIAVASLPWTITLAALTGVIIGVSVFFIPLHYVLLIWFFFGFALLAYLQSFIFRKIFVKYEPKKEEAIAELTEN